MSSQKNLIGQIRMEMGLSAKMKLNIISYNIVFQIICKKRLEKSLLKLIWMQIMKLILMSTCNLCKSMLTVKMTLKITLKITLKMTLMIALKVTLIKLQIMKKNFRKNQRGMIIMKDILSKMKMMMKVLNIIFQRKRTNKDWRRMNTRILIQKQLKMFDIYDLSNMFKSIFRLLMK